MFLAEITKQALANGLRLEFAQADVTVRDDGRLLTHHGTGSARMTDRDFILQVTPRHHGLLQQEFLDLAAETVSEGGMEIMGRERNGDTWNAVIEQFTHSTRIESLVMHAREIRRIAQRHAHLPHVRLRLPITADAARPPAVHGEPLGAGFRLSVGGIENYLEITLHGSAERGMVDVLLDALNDALGTRVACVYQEMQSQTEQFVAIRPSPEAHPVPLSQFSAKMLQAALLQHIGRTRPSLAVTAS